MKKMSIGGQALVEGVLMRSPHFLAASIRKRSGEITTVVERFESIQERFPFLKWPLLRGNAALIEMMIAGSRYMQWSSDQALEDSAQAGESKHKEMPVWLFWLTAMLGFGLGIALFVVLPNLAVDWIFHGVALSHAGRNLAEALIKLALLVGYLWLIGRRSAIRRVFEYHGAEHKTIYAFENGQPLTADGARGFDTPHPRCGTGFLLLTVFVSLVLFSVLPWGAPVMRILMRLLLLPVVAGICYEILRMTSSTIGGKLAAVFVIPGMWLQRLTTRQPDDSQLEVACAAASAVLQAESERTTEPVPA